VQIVWRRQGEGLSGWSYWSKSLAGAAKERKDAKGLTVQWQRPVAGNAPAQNSGCRTFMLQGFPLEFSNKKMEGKD